MSASLIGKDGTAIATVTNGVPVFTGDASASPAGVGAMRLFSENDPGTLTGTPYLKSPETSVDYRLRVGMDTYLLDHTFSETALDTTRWRLSGVTTMTAAMSGGLLQLNASAASTVSGNYVSFTSCRNFRIRGAAPLFVEMELQFSAAPLVNQIIECGLYLPAAGTQPIDGVWLQFTNAGVIGTLNYGGSITQTGVFPGTATYTANKSIKYAIVLSDRDLEFWADDVLLGELNIPTAQSAPCLTDSLPVTLMQRNNGIVAASVQAVTKIGNICVTAGDMQGGKSFPSIMCGMGHMGYQGQAGNTMGSTALYPNATAATTVTGAALSQTVTLATGLGGQVGITATVPGVDGFAFSYQNPVGSTIIPPRNLSIMGIKISSVNLGAAVATTPTTIAWSLAFGATGATIPSLAATETGSLTAASIKAYRRIPLGIQSFVVGALVGAQVPDTVMSFQSPVVVHPGEWVALVGKVIQGTATAAQVIFVNATVDSHFD
jgi:hypothetical protein